jgi:HPt (histidine-containing phosphotransfer) domain-containing protein
MDGYQLVREIRRIEAEAPGRARTPIVMFTANAIEDDRKCCDAGVDVCLVKPVTLETLRRTLAVWLPKAKAHDRPAAAAARPSHFPAVLPALAHFTGGDPQVERELVGAYLATAEADSARLREALARDELHAVMQAAHRIKGASRMIGAGALAAAAEKLESCARHGACSVLQAAASDCVRELDRLSAQLRETLRCPG